MRSLAQIEHELREIVNVLQDVATRADGLHQDVTALLIGTKLAVERQKRDNE